MVLEVLVSIPLREVCNEFAFLGEIWGDAVFPAAGASPNSRCTGFEASFLAGCGTVMSRGELEIDSVDQVGDEIESYKQDYEDDHHDGCPEIAHFFLSRQLTIRHAKS